MWNLGELSGKFKKKLHPGHLFKSVSFGMTDVMPLSAVHKHASVLWCGRLWFAPSDWVICRNPPT